MTVLLRYFIPMFFEEAVLVTGHSSQPRSCVIDDFNNDDHMDVAVANSGTDNIGIFLGYGNITFSSQMTFSSGFEFVSVLDSFRVISITTLS